MSLESKKSLVLPDELSLECKPKWLWFSIKESEIHGIRAWGDCKNCMTDENSHVMREILDQETSLNLYKEQIKGIPIWRIIRFRARIACMKNKFEISHNTRKKKVLNSFLLRNFVVSFFKILHFLMIPPKESYNFFFAFPRLQNLDGVVLDKFSDPVIEGIKDSDSSIVFQKPILGQEDVDRFKATDTFISTAAVDYLSMVFGIVFSPLVLALHGHKVVPVYKRSRNAFALKKKHLLTFVFRLGMFLFLYHFYSLLFSRVQPKRVFVVDREIFFAVILACKKKGIPVYELQHGVTHGMTPLYSGPYNANLDPDNFLAFGSAWIAPVFGVPESRIINIGWAYKDFVKARAKILEEYPENHILVVSTPEWTNEILVASLLLAEKFSGYTFDIRLHPQESLSEEQLEKIDNRSNLRIAGTQQDSLLAVGRYKYVVGVNSTVLFEALFENKVVGRLGFSDLVPEMVHEGDGFFYLDSVSDFEKFIDTTADPELRTDEYFSNFDADAIARLPIFNVN